MTLTTIDAPILPRPVIGHVRVLRPGFVAGPDDLTRRTDLPPILSQNARRGDED
jgi:hypothetical protein